MKGICVLIGLLLPISLWSQTDYELLAGRLRTDAIKYAGFKATAGGDFSASAAYLSSMNADGSWPDMNYADTKNTWSPLKHLDRMLVMTYAYYKDSCALYK